MSDLKMPSVPEQARILIRLVGDRSKGQAGADVPLALEEAAKEVGAASKGATGFLFRDLESQGLVDLTGRTQQGLIARLTMNGWREYELLREQAESRRAFMAMDYGSKELDIVFREAFRPAVEKAGFQLVRLDEQLRAGLIDDQLRVEIRTSRFLIADLTHGNQGAYWEAGFAEGLGKPVIYTCERKVFEDKAKRPHFDTNHLTTVVWEPDDLAAAASRLTATIRATLPTEARLLDE